MAVLQYQSEKNSLDLQVSLDGRTFATGVFPPTLRLDQHVRVSSLFSTDTVV